MTTILLMLAAFGAGYWWGKRVGIALVMKTVENLLEDFRRIQGSFKQWNEDQL